MLRLAATVSGQSYSALMREYMQLSFGPGKLRFDDYIDLALYDRDRYCGADKRSFVGNRAMVPIWQQANFYLEPQGVVANKVTMGALLAAYGFPVIATKALFSSKIGFAAEHTLRTREALIAFLLEPANFPLFGKPVDGLQSLGCASFERCEPDTARLVTSNGKAIDVEEFADELIAHFGEGYVFQPRMSPYAANAAICGNRLGTVRVITLLREEGPQIFRACEKMPAGDNLADNYWREGNLLVRLDRNTGQRGPAVSGKGGGLRTHTHHPDSGMAIEGTMVPHWDNVCELALEGARLFKDVPLVGWDIAVTDGGGVIVEANERPDFILPQLADARGVLDEELQSFLEERRRARKAWKRELMQNYREIERPSWSKSA